MDECTFIYVQWTCNVYDAKEAVIECPMDISVLPMDEWTFECPMDIPVCPKDEWTFKCAMDISGRPIDEWTFECPMDTSVRPMDEWTFLFVQWTNGHFCLYNGRMDIYLCPMDM